MSYHTVQLVDLPNEILFIILRKLDNIDVLYSLFNIGNQRLDMIAQDHTFANNLNFISMSSNDNVCSVSDGMLDRFCVDILPRIHQNVKSLIVESSSMERTLLGANYPNLTELKLFNFNEEIFSRYFTEDLLCQHIHKQQLTDLILVSNENKTNIEEEDYTMNVYANLLILFKYLKHLAILPSSSDNYSVISLRNLSRTTFSSSTLTKLCVKVSDFGSCLALLDDRLKNLTTFIVEVLLIGNESSTSYNHHDLSNLKYFSLICYNVTEQYDNQVVPLLRRMSNLEELTVYLRILNRPTFVDGCHLDNEILTHMPRLHAFTFYISTENYDINLTPGLSNDEIQQTFTNIRIRQVASIVDYFNTSKAACHVFSLPFKFTRLEHITNNFPNVVFNYVVCLSLVDRNPFKHEFFIRIAQSFPILKYLSVYNLKPPCWEFSTPQSVDDDWCSIVQYPHLISLDISVVDIHYIEHFLNQTKTDLPRLTELKIKYKELKTVTKNFTRDVTRNNCANVKRLIVGKSIVHVKDIHHYFPLLLSVKSCSYIFE